MSQRQGFITSVWAACGGAIASVWAACGGVIASVWSEDGVPPYVVRDSFTDPPGTNLTAHIGEVGAAWLIHPVTAGAQILIDLLGRIYAASAALAYAFASGVPISPDYTVSADITRLDAAVSYGSIAGRHDTVLDTCYSWGYNPAAARWELYRVVAGVANPLLGVEIVPFTVGTTEHLDLTMTGQHIVVKRGGVVKVDVVDVGGVAAAGRAAVRFYSAGGMAAGTGLHIDNFQVPVT